jgi:hypothetical protein
MFNFFSRGKLEVVPEKYNYSFGEVVKGVVKLSLKKVTHANKLSLWLIGQQTITAMRPATSFSKSGTTNLPMTQRQTSTVFQFELPLDSEKDYLAGEYPFEINIPNNIMPLETNAPSPLGGIASQALNITGVLGGMPMSSSRIDWKLEAVLDISGAIDMRKNVSINIA